MHLCTGGQPSTWKTPSTRTRNRPAVWKAGGRIVAIAGFCVLPPGSRLYGDVDKGPYCGGGQLGGGFISRSAGSPPRMSLRTNRWLSLSGGIVEPKVLDVTLVARTRSEIGIERWEILAANESCSPPKERLSHHELRLTAFLCGRSDLPQHRCRRTTGAGNSGPSRQRAVAPSKGRRCNACVQGSCLTPGHGRVANLWAQSPRAGEVSLVRGQRTNRGFLLD